MGIWNAEMRYKNKLAQRGKGNRRNRRFVSLSRGDFEKVSYFDTFHGISDGDRRTHPVNVKPHTASPDDARVNTRPRHRAFEPLRVVKLPDGTEVLQ